MTAKPPPIPPRLTREQYLELDRLGHFDHRRVELIYGEVVEMSPINWPHALGVDLVSQALTTVFAVGFFVRMQQAFPVPSEPIGSMPQPDVAVISGAPRDYTDHPTTAALLVEVSASTLAFDTTEKAEMYATAGVPEYWVLDVENRQLHVFRDPAPLQAELEVTAYRTRLTLAPADRVSPLAAPNASILVSDLLP